MKKTLSVLVVLMVVSSVVFARRVDNPGASPSAVIVKIGTTFKLYYKGSEQADVKVSIRDASEKVLFTETIRKSDGFVRPYNFSNLPNGNYTIHISDKNGSQIEKVNFQREKVETHAHLLKVAGSAKYLLTVVSKEDGNVTVRIYDDANNVIYNKKEQVAKDFARIYNLEGVPGQFTFEITDANGTSTSLPR